MNRPAEIVLVGAGGYGGQYLDALLSPDKPRACRLVGVVEPFLESCRRLPELHSCGTPVYPNLEAFVQRHRADLAVVVSPIHLHCAHTCLALENGLHVLTEKPLCACLEQIDQMRSAQRRAGKHVTVGFQWSFSPAVQRLKADILAGRFGRARRLRTLAALPRDEEYFTRNRWAGRQTSDEGMPILDSPVNNAAAHFLHNMLYVLGEDMDTSALPVQIDAELGRANPIENYDTAALRIRVAGGVELLFYTSHAVAQEQSHIFTYEFEKATVRYEPSHGHIVATMADGETIDYGSPEADPFQKLWSSIDMVTTGKPPVCGIDAAAAHATCVIQAQKVVGGIQDFPASAIRVDRTRLSPVLYVVGLQEAMNRCYAEGKLFSEIGFSLSLPGSPAIHSPTEAFQAAQFPLYP